jgi:hypothetical protein
VTVNVSSPTAAGLTAGAAGAEPKVVIILERSNTAYNPQALLGEVRCCVSIPQPVDLSLASLSWKLIVFLSREGVS